MDWRRWKYALLRCINKQTTVFFCPMFSKSSTNRLKGESRIPRPVQLNNTRPTQLNNTATENRIPLMKGKHDKPQRFKVADKRPLAKEFVKEPPKPISKQELQKPAVRKPEVFDNKALIDILNSTNSLDLDGKFTSARPKRASIYAGAVRVLKPVIISNLRPNL
jgi:hypothetical protein